MQVWTLRDGQISLEASLLQGLDQAEVRRMLGGKDAAQTPVNAFLVRMGGQTVLVDTGIGKDPEEDSGHLLAQLAAAGVKASDVDLVLITHYHFDHIGGLLNADGTRAFPKAMLRVPRREHTFWLQEPSTLPERLRGRIPKLKAIFSAYESAGAFRTFEVGETLLPGLRAWAEPDQTGGHTGGHTLYAFSSEGQELWCIGDLIHFGAVQFERPEAGISFDLDGPRAVRIRREIFQQAAKKGAVLAGAHLPELVRLEAKGAGFLARPVSKP
jgi:glyoxylase-like metal-dependent hydrolase (beta-lactamase superfamily II)